MEEVLSKNVFTVIHISKITIIIFLFYSFARRPAFVILFTGTVYVYFSNTYLSSAPSTKFSKGKFLTSLLVFASYFEFHLCYPSDFVDNNTSALLLHRVAHYEHNNHDRYLYVWHSYNRHKWHSHSVERYLICGVQLQIFAKQPILTATKEIKKIKARGIILAASNCNMFDILIWGEIRTCVF